MQNGCSLGCLFSTHTILNLPKNNKQNILHLLYHFLYERMFNTMTTSTNRQLLFPWPVPLWGYNHSCRWKLKCLSVKGDLYERNDKPGLIIGDDLAETFDTWKEAALLADMVNLIVAHRLSRERLKIDFPCTYIDNSLLPVSSSEIRDRIARGKSVQYLLPRRVFRYIKRHGLYSGD